jgi:hypothetical protein
MSRSLTRQAIEAKLDRLLWDNRTWGETEALAGIKDRLAFWRGLDESTALRRLRELIRERIGRGEL